MSLTVEKIIAIIFVALLVIAAQPFLLVAFKDSIFCELAATLGNMIECFCKWWLAAWREILPRKKTKEDAAGLPESAKQELLDSFMKGADK